MKAAIIGTMIRARHDKRLMLLAVILVAYIADDGCDCDPWYGDDHGRY